MCSFQDEQNWSNISRYDCKASLLLANNTISSAYNNALIESPFIDIAPEIDDFKLFARSSINKLNRSGLITSPCFTPQLEENVLLNPPANLILHLLLAYTERYR